MKTITFKVRATAIAVAAALGIVAGMSGNAPELSAGWSLVASAQAAEGGTAKGAGGPTGDQGKKGSASGSGQGQGGPSADSDAKGPKFGGSGSKPAPGTQGGAPVWAKEGVPSDLELGRLSVVRAPAQVLARQLAEAQATLTLPFYNKVIEIANNAALTPAQKLEALKALVKESFVDGTIYVRVDSPLQNLALYKDVFVDGIINATAGTLTATSYNAALMMMAVFIGSASDKTITITPATVDAINKIMLLTPAAGAPTATDVGNWAEEVRKAIAEAHG
jgi:hypothetical protein